jgi:hypothetical protein
MSSFSARLVNFTKRALKLLFDAKSYSPISRKIFFCCDDPAA